MAPHSLEAWLLCRQVEVQVECKGDANAFLTLLVLERYYLKG